MNVTSRENSFRVSLARAIFLLRSGRFRDFFSAFSRKLKSAQTVDENDLYQKWITKYEPEESSLTEIKVWSATLKNPPLVSFILKNASDIELVSRTLESIRKQFYEHWEVLIESNNPTLLSKIHFDNRIRSAGKDLQRDVAGQWIAPVSEGDTLSSSALAEIVRLTEARSNLDFIYSDHDWINESGVRTEPYFKPDWSPEFLQNSPYTGRLALYRTDLVRNKTFWNDEHSWLSDAAKTQLQAVRIAKVLYHYASRPSYTSSKTNAYSDQSAITILVPTRDQPVRLKAAIHSILEKTKYPRFEVVIINNQSSHEDTLRYFQECKKDGRIRVIDYALPFNFSAINNFGITKIDSDYVVFLNDDTEVISSSWLEEMLAYCCRNEIGAVGAKLLHRDRTIQHAGILLGLPEIAVHAHRGWTADSEGYRGRLKSVQNFNAVTAACMMVRKKLFLEIGGFDEKLALAFNDVDLCLRLRERGYRIVWTPHAELFHDESVSRGYEATLERQKRLSSESNYFLERWKNRIETGDPYYNPNLSLANGAFRIRT
jgi:GT2 family glycosyltransferase